MSVLRRANCGIPRIPNQTARDKELTFERKRERRLYDNENQVSHGDKVR